MVLLSGCIKPEGGETKQSSTSEEPQTVGSNTIGNNTSGDRIILPEATVKTMDWNDIFHKIKYNKKDSDYATWGRIGENYFGLRTANCLQLAADG